MCYPVHCKSSYKILNPAEVAKQTDPKKCAEAILDATGLDPELYRLGHTKAWNPTHSTVWKMTRLIKKLIHNDPLTLTDPVLNKLLIIEYQL